MAEDDGEVVGFAAYNGGYWGEEIVWLLVNETGDLKLVGDMLAEEAEKHVQAIECLVTGWVSDD